MIECTICYNCDLSNVGALPCGHIYCIPCVKRHLARSSDCPTCRSRCTAAAIIRLFPDWREEATSTIGASTSTTLSPQLLARVEKAEELIRTGPGLGVESDSEQLEDIVAQGEIVTLGLAHEARNPIMSDVLERLYDTLAALRLKLKYSARLTSAKMAHADTLTVVKEKDIQMQRLLRDAQVAKRDLDTQTQLVNTYVARDEEWARKYERLKRKLEQEVQQRVSQLDEIRDEVQTQTAKVLRYKKKYLAAERELKASRNHGPMRPMRSTTRQRQSASEHEDSDSLEVVDEPPSSQAGPSSSQPRPVAGIADDRDSSSRENSIEVDEALRFAEERGEAVTGHPRGSRPAKRVPNNKHASLQL